MYLLVFTPNIHMQQDTVILLVLRYKKLLVIFQLNVYSYEIICDLSRS